MFKWFFVVVLLFIDMLWGDLKILCDFVVVEKLWG